MAKKKKQEVRDNYNDYIIGIDLSLNDSGVAVYSMSEDKIVYSANCNTTNVRKLKKYEGYNLNAIKMNIQREFFEDIKYRFPPKLVIFEAGFAKFKKEVEALNQINGVVYSVFWEYTQIKYAPTSVKAEIAHGRAEKEDVRDVLIHNLPEIQGDKQVYENDNISDAVAVVVTHLLKTGIYKKSEWDKLEHGKKIKKKRVIVKPDISKLY